MVSFLKFIRRFLYIFYYIKQTNWNLFNKFFKYTFSVSGLSKFRIISQMIYDSYKYNISLLDYFQFRFYEIDGKEKTNWAGTGFMYEYQLKMNPKSKRNILDNKKLFYQKYKEFFKHNVFELDKVESDNNLIFQLLNHPSGKLVFKSSNGKCGSQVVVKETRDLTSDSFVDFMNNNKFDLVEEFICQHSDLNLLSPTAVNTVRIFTQLDKNDKVEILGCRLRISVNSNVDNLAAGNLAAAIDEKTGIVIGDAVYSDITKKDESLHPVTKVPIKGFKIPYWEETVKLAKDAALTYKQNRSVGWDIAITENGPDLIEGNHDWCKLLWQLPVKEGLKPLLLKHLN